MTRTTPSESERRARATLAMVGEPGHRGLHETVVRHGAEELLRRLSGEAGRPRGAGLAADLAGRLARIDPVRELDRAAAAGIRFVVPGDEEWPAALDDLAHGPLLHERGGVPLGLWVRGPLSLAETARHAVAVVGSRSATTYGTEIAGTLAAEVGAAGETVVSGAAIGIDGAAHRGALAVRAPTIAVLACGVDRVYPEAHGELLRHIAERGLVVSETPPGGAPMRVRFLARNRLIAAMSAGTVVVEAAVRSGALNTASWAAGLGRVLMGVPGPVTSAPSAGVHQLVRNRGAVLVTSGAEVLEAVGPIGEHLLGEAREPARPGDGLGPEERQVLDAVPVRHPAASASIADTAGLARDKVDHALRRLREAGLVERAGGRWLVARQRSADRYTEDV